MRRAGFSLREIGEALGASAATVMRDCRGETGAESALVASERAVAASGESGVGNTTGGGGLASLDGVEREMETVYAALAAGENIPLARVRLLLARYAALAKRDESCRDHVTLRQLQDECNWRDGLWVNQLRVAVRQLRQSGCADAERIINDMMDAVSAQTAAGRGE